MTYHLVLTCIAHPEMGVRDLAVKGEVPYEEGVRRYAKHPTTHAVLGVLQVAQECPQTLGWQHRRGRLVCRKKKRCKYSNGMSCSPP